MWQKLQLNFPKLSFYTLLISLPLGTRISIYPEILIYLSDILMILFLAVFYWKIGDFFWQKPKSLFIFLFFAGLSVLLLPLPREVVAYNFVHLVLLVLTALAAAKVLQTGSVKAETVLSVLASSAVLQSILGAAQFIKQTGSEVPGVAKIIVDDAKVMRAYGTFPHPNVLAAFLLLGLLSLYNFWLKRPSEWKLFTSFKNLASDLMIGIGIFIVALGLLISFSRTAWAIAILISILAIGYAVAAKVYLRQGIRLLILLLAVSILLFANFSPYISSRAKISIGEPAVVLRSTYNKIGWEIIKSRPLGVGIGNQVAFSRESGLYQKFGLTETWQQQPIHNIYLLIASEIGTLGLLAFLFFLAKAMFNKSSSIIPKIMLLALLLLGLTDHFLWTFQSGQLMLWLTSSLVIGLNGLSAEAPVVKRI